ncbi:MAG: AAA family ATPase, partial [Endomicrobium sp.]|nr:AAA family ATPase [Endomicrobium sp.]
MKKLSIGIQSFQDLRENDYLYVDKTNHIYQLINSGK